MIWLVISSKFFSIVRSEFTERKIHYPELGAKFNLSYLFLQKAGALFELKNSAESETYMRKSKELATELGIKDVELQSKILEMKIKNDPEGLIKILTEESHDDEQRAAVNYELWKLTSQNTYRNDALVLYRKLRDRTPIYDYLQKIEELEKANL